MLTDCDEPIVAVEDHSQSVNEPEVAASNVAGKGFQVVVIKSEITYEFCEGEVVIRDNHS